MTHQLPRVPRPGTRSGADRRFETHRYGRSVFYANSTILRALGLHPEDGYMAPTRVRYKGWWIAFSVHRAEHPELEYLARERLLPLQEELRQLLRALLAE